MRILFVKLGAIGDIIHTLPALNAVRHGHPDAVVSWVAEQRSAEILRGNPLIDNLIEVDTRSLRGGKVVEKMLLEGSKQIRSLREHNFDVALDFQGLLKSGLIAKLSGARERWGFARTHLREPASRIFYTKAIKLPLRSHVIHANLALVTAAFNLGPDQDSVEFPIFTAPMDQAEAASMADRTRGDFAILNPAGGWVTKLWHARKYGQLADMIWDELGLHSVVVCGPNEADLAAEVVANSRSGRTLIEQPTLKGFYELARLAKVYVGGDTGPTHLAIAAGAPIVGIFGPTEWWRNGSLNPNDICVERLDIGCRVDCHRRACLNWICMDVGPEVVLEAVKRRLSPVRG
ncbi:MAG TPA: glycosyltransferase family 9 protein [Pyrinomonadaceae bacterium]|nr:glycosyltransferase family 9 protein [Pyrinomonadaceae bacterium]